MQTENVIDALNERIKELTCLYEISNIVVRHQDSFDETMEAVVKSLPKAWKYQKSAIAEIRLTERSFLSEPLLKRTVQQTAPIKAGGKQHGILLIHYPADQFTEQDFLKEEQLLLENLAREINTTIERFEQKEREELIERKILHTDRLTVLSEISAGIAHELNTPLANILGFAQLIEGNEAPVQINNDIKKIISSTLYAREIVKKLMFFSSEMPQQRQSVAINDLIDDAIKLLSLSLQKAGLTVHFTPAPHNVILQLDSIQMTQVVFNLLINAIHATPRGGDIFVKLHTNDNKLIMEFKDTGQGIPSRIKERIFEPFFTTKPVGEGTGLGLSVVHGIIKSQNGSIKVKSQEGKGTTFIIALPLED